MLKTLRITVGSLSTFILPSLHAFSLQLVQGLAYVLCYLLLTNVLKEQGTDRELFIEGALLLFTLPIYCYAFYSFCAHSMNHGFCLAANLREKLALHLKDLPLATFRKRGVSTLSGNFLNDMMYSEHIFSFYIYDITSTLSIILLFGCSFLFVNTTLGVTILITSLMALPILWYALKEFKDDSKTMVKDVARTDKTLLEYLNGIGELKATGMTGERFYPWIKANKKQRDFALYAEIHFTKLGYCYLTFLEISFLITMTVATYLCSTSAIESSVFLFFMLLCGRYYEPMQEISSSLVISRICFVSLNRIAETLQEKALPQKEGYQKPESHSVEFHKVSFSYVEKNEKNENDDKNEKDEKKVLDNISFVMPEGGVTALVGESGSGKTTATNLLLRFMDVNSGKITIGGTDIRTFAQEDLYSLFSVVFQDVYLFNDTVMNNIRIAKPSATDAEVIKAAKKACCHDFIMSFEEQYQTSVGEKGARLSGGERQRIAIARATLKDSPILILDEATASIDPENELLIQQGLTNLMRGKTLLVIAHRLSTIQKANQILVLSKGQIVEQGKHDDLLNLGGIYNNLWQKQGQLRSWVIK